MAELGLDLSIWIALCLVGFVAGFIDAIAGGGGMLTVPMLLTAGLPPHIALGTNKLAASFGSLTASITYYKKRLFDPLFWRISAITTAVFAIIGTLVVNFIPVDLLAKVLPVVILVSAIYTIFVKTNADHQKQLPERNNALKVKQFGQAASLGFYDGVAGPGTGAFWTVSSLMLYKTNLLICSGLAKNMNFISNFCSLLTFIYLGQINIYLGLAMGVFIMFGAWVGAHSAIRYGSQFIRPIFIFIVACLSAKLAYDSWFITS